MKLPARPCERSSCACGSTPTRLALVDARPGAADRAGGRCWSCSRSPCRTGSRTWSPARSCGCRWRRSSTWRSCWRCRPASSERGRVLAVVAGVVLGLTAVFTVLDIGFMAALNRPFDALIDWRYAGSLVETVRGSAEGRAGDRAPRAGRHCSSSRCSCCSRSRCCGSRAWCPGTEPRRSGWWRCSPPSGSCSACWTCARSTGSVASRKSAAYVYGQVSRIPSELRDQDEFARAAETDPMRSVPAGRSADRPARQGRAARVRRELRPRRGGGLELRAGRQRGPRLRHPAAGAVRLRQPQRLPHLPHLRCRQLARALDPPVGAVGRQPAALRPARDQSAPDPERALRTGRMADGRRHPGQHPGLAAGCLLRLRPRLRLAQRRLPRARGSATRPCRTSTPSTRSTASSSRRRAEAP